MNDTELIQALRPMALRDKFQCLGCGHEHQCSTHGCAILKQALERLEQLTAPEPNIPLTLEELREMDGEPIWVVPLVQEYTGEDDEEGEDMEPRWSIAHAFHFHGDGGGYGDRWLAYRRKPEEV